MKKAEPKVPLFTHVTVGHYHDKQRNLQHCLYGLAKGRVYKFTFTYGWVDMVTAVEMEKVEDEDDLNWDGIYRDLDNIKIS